MAEQIAGIAEQITGIAEQSIFARPCQAGLAEERSALKRFSNLVLNNYAWRRT